MTDDEETHAAAAYVALSNAHRLDLVGAMFADDAVYRSANVGTHEGAEAIAAMMSGFFAKFPDVHWAVERYEHEGDRWVAFDFRMTGTNAEDGSPLDRASRERVCFDAAGRLIAIEVL